MQMGDRKKKILKAIIQDYIETAEPVGSRSIAKRYIPDLSSATIRNEMADLEEMGYLAQPHTSAGRIPSDRGYRLFVDSLMRKYALSMQEMMHMQNVMEEKIQELDVLIERAAQALTNITQYTSVALTPDMKKGRLMNMQVVSLQPRKVLLILVTEQGVMKNRIVHTEHEINSEQAYELSGMFNRFLAGLTLEEITPERIEQMRTLMTQYGDIMTQMVDFVTEVIGETERSVLVQGSVNLLNLPEYSDIERAKDVLQFLENKESLGKILPQVREDGIHVIIGHENPTLGMHGCSIVLYNYKVGKIGGSIGLVGPTRMDYSKVVAALEFLKNQIEMLPDKEHSQD